MKSLDVRRVPARLGLALLAAGLGSACTHDRDYSKRDAHEDRYDTRQASSRDARTRAGEDQDSLPAGYERDPSRPIGEQRVEKQPGTIGGQQQQQRPVVNDPSAARFARTLPSFSLADPLGQRHDKDTIIGAGQPCVFVVTAPTLGAGGDQKDWNDALVKSAPAGAKVILIEDMSQSGFRGRALDRMREDFEPDGQTLLLLDDDGAVRKQLGVGEGETVVLLYDSQGNLVQADQADASVERAREIWSAAQTSFQKRTYPGQQPMIERDR